MSDHDRIEHLAGLVTIQAIVATILGISTILNAVAIIYLARRRSADDRARQKRTAR